MKTARYDSVFWDNHKVPLLTPLDAFIVHSQQWHDYHRHLIFFVRSYGLVSAFSYGYVSKRSTIRAAAQPYTFGTLVLKRGRRADGIHQIQDWEICFPNLALEQARQQNIRIYSHCSFWCEILLHAHGLGENDSGLFEELQELFRSIFLVAPERQKSYCCLATLRFCWQFLLAEGVNPGLGGCHQCGGALALLKEPIFFSWIGEILCRVCARKGAAVPLPLDGLNLLCWADRNVLDFSPWSSGELYDSVRLDALSLNLIQRLCRRLEELFNQHLQSKFFLK